MAEGEPRRVQYPTWNLVIMGLLVALSLGDVVSASTDHPGHPALWGIGAFIAVTSVWGVRERRRRPSWLLPRFYLLVAIPSGLALLLAGDTTAVGLGLVWLLIVPALLGSDLLDRRLGAPPRRTPTS